MSDVVQQAREIIEARVREIDDEREQLERALGKLTGAEDGRSRRSRARSKAAGSRTPRKRTDSASAGAVAEYLRTNPKASTAEVVEALGLRDGRVVGAQRRRIAAEASG